MTRIFVAIVLVFLAWRMVRGSVDFAAILLLAAAVLVVTGILTIRSAASTSLKDS